MKHKLLILILIMGLLSLANIGFASEVKFQKFTDDKFHFKLEFPANWAVQLDRRNPFSLTFIQPIEHSKDPFNERIQIQISKKLNKIKTAQFYKESIQKIEKVYNNNDFFIIKKSNTKLSNYPAIEVVYKLKLNGLELRGKSIFLSVGHIVYSFGGMEYNNSFKKFEKIYNKLLKSFIIPKPKKSAKILDDKTKREEVEKEISKDLKKEAETSKEGIKKDVKETEKSATKDEKAKNKEEKVGN